MPRLQEPSFLVLTALAAGPQHGYGVIKDVETLSGGQVTLRVGTLCGALDRLAADGLVAPDHDEVVDSRLRRYYRLAVGRQATAAPPAPGGHAEPRGGDRPGVVAAAVAVGASEIRHPQRGRGAGDRAGGGRAAGATRTAGRGRPAGLPQRFAGHSDATGSVSDAPPGRAIALYQQGSEPAEDIVLSADRDAYRQLDLATTHRTGDPGGTPAPALLAPDGTELAVQERSSSALRVVGLDGTTRRALTLQPGTGLTGPAAWSPDGRLIAVSQATASRAVRRRRNTAPQRAATSGP